MSEREAKKELMRRAKDIDATVRVGKEGLSENICSEIEAQLKKRRLVKVKILKNQDADITQVSEEIIKSIDQVVVDTRGGVITLTDKRTWTSLCQKKFD